MKLKNKRKDAVPLGTASGSVLSAALYELPDEVGPLGNELSEVTEALVECIAWWAHPHIVVELRLRRQHSGNLEVALHEVFTVVVYLLYLLDRQLDTGQFQLVLPDGRDGGGAEDTLDDDECILIQDEVQPLGPAVYIGSEGGRYPIGVVEGSATENGAPLASGLPGVYPCAVRTHIGPERAPAYLVARGIQPVRAVRIVQAPDVLGSLHCVVPSLTDGIIGASVD